MRARAWVLVACVAALGACAQAPQGVETEATTEPVASSPSPMPGELAYRPSPTVPGRLVGTWTLVAIDGEPVSGAGTIPTVEIDEHGEAAGVAGVNRFRTQLGADDGKISVGAIAATKMAGPQEAMEVEDAFLQHLGSADGYQVAGDTLRLTTAGDEVLTFERSEPDDE